MSDSSSASPPGWVPAVVVLTLVAAAYTPLVLWGGWVWDDWKVLADNPRLAEPLRLLVTGVSAETSSDYRPLPMLLHAVLQALAPGPRIERVVTVGLHLAAVSMLALSLQRLGIGRGVAWVSAGAFGLHAGAVEAVAASTGTADLCLGVLFVGAWLCFTGGRDVLAGVLLGLSAFAKEPGVLAPIMAGVWMLGSRRWSPRLMGVTTAISVFYVIVRMSLGMVSTGDGSSPGRLLASLGGMSRRGAELVLVPGTSDALVSVEPTLWLGVTTVVFAVVLLALAVGRPPVAMLVTALMTLAPHVLAVDMFRLVAERYYYTPLMGLAACLALGFARLPIQWPAWLLLAALWPTAALRANDWRNDGLLFGASLARDPDNARAALYLASYYHTQLGDCETAIPLYEQSLAFEGRKHRALNNLLACHIGLGQFDEALAIGPRAAGAAPDDAMPAANMARVHMYRNELDEARKWMDEALHRAPSNLELQCLRSQILAEGGASQAADAVRRRVEELRGQPCDP